MTGTTAARTAALLLVATAALFAIGVSRERGDEHAEPSAAGHNEPEAAHEGEGTETADHREAEERATADHEASKDERRTLLGVDPEWTGAVAAAVVISLALAGGLWFAGRRELAAAAAVIALVFTLLDALEVPHQLNEDRTGLAALAATIALGHLAAALAAGYSAGQPQTAQKAP